ncbi:MAG: sulfite exporter TauE/SafE family protein [Oscillospiraceae bacterium]|nr:sulfite exporter TauE/SafE family protein [Oscillospiraceae bacterium]
MKTIHKILIGLSAGVLNGLFGSGGGVVTVPLLERSGVEQRKCHATSVVLIFVLSFISVGMYAINDNLDFVKTLEFIPSGLVGALVGATLLKKVKNNSLKRIFGLIIIASAIRMFVA